jgi:hypothetical protein
MEGLSVGDVDFHGERMLHMGHGDSGRFGLLHKSRLGEARFIPLW